MPLTTGAGVSGVVGVGVLGCSLVPVGVGVSAVGTVAAGLLLIQIAAPARTKTAMAGVMNFMAAFLSMPELV